MDFQTDSLHEVGNLADSLNEFDRYEKFSLLLGVIALYGDGEFSEPEIKVLENFLKEIKFEPSTLVHADPSNEKLCLKEKTAWVIEFVKDNFVDVKLTPDEIEELFEEVLKSCVNDKTSSSVDGAFNAMVLKTVKKLIKADGEVSENEKKLLKITREVTQQTFLVYTVMAVILLGIIYAIYAFFTWIF